jgi:hypothetical protein
MTDHLQVAEHHSRLMLEAQKEKQPAHEVSAAVAPLMS